MSKDIVENLVWHGRYFENDGIKWLGYSASGFSFLLKGTKNGTKATATFVSDSSKWPEDSRAVLGVFINEVTELSQENLFRLSSLSEEPAFEITLKDDVNEVVLFDSAQEKTVCIHVLKLTEQAYALSGLKELKVDGEVLSRGEKNQAEPLRLEFLGDSITCGYGIEGVWEKDEFTTQHERADKAYAFLTAKDLDKLRPVDFQLCSWSGTGVASHYIDVQVTDLPDVDWLLPAFWPYTNKDLSLRLGLEPQVWDETLFSPDIVVLNIGTNDISWVQSKPDRELIFTGQYRQLLEAVHRRSPKAKIICTIGAMGDALNTQVQNAVDQFHKNFPSVVIKTHFFPVQKEEDGIATHWHPSALTHQKMAQSLTKVINELI